MLEQLVLKQTVLLHFQGCCLLVHGSRRTYVYTCVCSGDGLCQALHPTLPCLPWNWQHSFFEKTAGAGSHASNQLLGTRWSSPRGVCPLGSCAEGLGDWLDCPSPPRRGAGEPEMHAMLGTAGPNCPQLFLLLLPLLAPCLKVKPRKVIIGL